MSMSSLSYRPRRQAERQLAKDGGIRGDINVTPLVDVCLVLLIIFMVVTPMLGKSDVQLAKTANPERMPEDRKQLTISMRVDGSVEVENDRVSAERLEGLLADVHAEAPDREVVVRADRRLRYGRVRELMRRINEAGFSHVGLVTEKIGSRPSEAPGGVEEL